MDTFISRGSEVGSGGTTASSRINPATEEKQTDSLSAPSTDGGTQKLTIPADPFQVAGSDQTCRSILVVHSSDNAVYMNLGAVADADDFLIPKNVVIPVPIDNCSKLNFFGTEADTIRLLWRN